MLVVPGRLKNKRTRNPEIVGTTFPDAQLRIWGSTLRVAPRNDDQEAG
jgi:hypothetical protein